VILGARLQEFSNIGCLWLNLACQAGATVDDGSGSGSDAGSGGMPLYVASRNKKEFTAILLPMGRMEWVGVGGWNWGLGVV